MKLNKYYKLTDLSPTYIAADVLHPRSKWASVNRLFILLNTSDDDSDEYKQYIARVDHEEDKMVNNPIQDWAETVASAFSDGS